MNKARLLSIASISNIFEWYDYTLFAHFAIIINSNFFPEEGDEKSLIKVFLVFALGYIVRPLGGVVFGVLGDKFGRKFSLTISVMAMSIPTFLLGILPTYQQIGYLSTISIILIRMIQGLSIGGALTGSISFVIEHTEPEYKCRVASVPIASLCLGILLGSLISALIQSVLTTEEFNSFGWRIPFILGGCVLFAGIYINKYALETPEFIESQNTDKVSGNDNQIKFFILRTLLSSYKTNMLVSIFIGSTGSVLFYLQAVYMPNYFKLNQTFSNLTINYLSNGAYVLIALAVLLCGWVADKIGPENVLKYLLFAIIILTYPMANYLASGDSSYVILSYVILSIFAAFHIALEPVLQANLYPVYIRNTGLSLTYNISTTIFGGATPYIMANIIEKSGTIISCSYYILGCACVGLICLKIYNTRIKL